MTTDIHREAYNYFHAEMMQSQQVHLRQLTQRHNFIVLPFFFTCFFPLLRYNSHAVKSTCFNYTD